MKLQLISDTHCEFLGYKWNIPITDSDIVVLAGDIGVGLIGVEWVVRQCEIHNKPFLYLFGNHEYYGEDFTLLERAKEYVQGTNVHILEKDIFEFGDYKIFGTTLWTDYCLYGHPQQKLAMKAASDFMNDHRLITYENHIFTPEDALAEHKNSFDWLYKELPSTGNNIVLTHHAPTFYASHPKYRGDMCTPAFASDLEWFILERRPLLWQSGHSHYVYQKYIGDTLCMSNTKGYKNENIMHFDPELIIEV